MRSKFTLLLALFSILFLAHFTLAQEQTINVEGIVTDEDGAIPGVNILLEGSTAIGTTTNIAGEYDLSVPANGKLVFSFIGYTTQTVAINGRSEINITLEINIESLSEVIVIGYGRTTKKKLTTAISSVGEEDIQDKPFPNIEQSIAGKAPGVQVLQPSGRPGGGISIRIRGGTSVGAGNEPLYVVDGVPVLNTEGINPTDVESIEILKDAASSSIYGARAANGVVLITTKRGSKNKQSLSFSSYVGQDMVTNTLELLNSQQYMDLLNKARFNAGQSLLEDPYDYEYNTDWQRELYDPALIQNYQLSFSGGSEEGTFYVSSGYQNQEGVISPSGFERYSLRFNQDRRLLPNLTFGNSMALSRTITNSINDNQRVNNGGVVLSALSTPPIVPVINADGTYPLNPFQAWENPVALVRGQDQGGTTNKILANIYGTYELPLNLEFKSSFSVDYNNSRFDSYTDPYTTGNGRAQLGEASTSTSNELVWLWENTVNYNETFGDMHNIDVLLGNSFTASRYESAFLLSRNFATATIPTAAGGSEPITADARVAEWSFISNFVRATYSFASKYVVTASMRADGSSRFGDGNKYGYFPSASAAWNITDEEFFPDLPWLYNLKLRYSFGLTGNANIGNYNSYGLYNTGANYVWGGSIVPGIFPSQLGNEELKWETTTQQNVGLDMDIFTGRLTAKIDAYYKRTDDLLLFKPFPTTSGYGGRLTNIGSLENKGLEVAINAKPLAGQLFQWDINANISANRNKVLEIGPQPLFAGGVPDQGNTFIVREGESLGNFYGWVAQDINPETGNVIFKDKDENGVINDNDREIIGNALPDFIWGLTNTLNYKGFELIIFLQGVQGQDVYNGTRFELESMSSFKNQSITTLDRWTPENTDGSLPIAIFGDPLDNDRVSSRWIEDGSFLKIRELTLGYTFPKSLIDRVGMSNAKIYAQARNFFTLTNYSGYDPEVSRDGGSTISPNIDYGTYPQVQSFLLGLNFGF